MCEYFVIPALCTSPMVLREVARADVPPASIGSPCDDFQ